MNEAKQLDNQLSNRRNLNIQDSMKQKINEKEKSFLS